MSQQGSELKNDQNKILTDFTRKQKSLLDEWSEKSIQAFLEWAKKYSEEIYTASQNIIHSKTNQSVEQHSLIDSLFRNFSQLRGIVKHGQKASYSLARIFYMKKLRSRYFYILRSQTQFSRYLRRMKLFVKNYRKNLIPRKVFERWKKATRDNIRTEIERQVNRRADTEIQKMSKEYEALIAQLESVLEKKLVELKVEEEQHRELLRRYEGIAEKRQLTLQKH